MRLQPKSVAPVVLLAAVAASCWAFEASGLRLNLTPSLPRGLYRFTEEPAAVDDLVAVCLPEELGQLGRRRGYVGAGTCPGGTAPLLKRVGAVAGDHVRIASDGVFVNQRRLQDPARSTDSKGRPLLPIPQQELVLGSGEIWVYAPHPRSWDSRFLGPLPRGSALGRVEAVWTLPSEAVAEAPSNLPDSGPSS